MAAELHLAHQAGRPGRGFGRHLGVALEDAHRPRPALGQVEGGAEAPDADDDGDGFQSGGGRPRDRGAWGSRHGHLTLNRHSTLLGGVLDLHGDAAICCPAVKADDPRTLRMIEHVTTDAHGRAELPLTLGLHPVTNTVGVSIEGRELATFHAEGLGTAVAELEGDYRTWHLPKGASVRLGKGTLGEGDRAVALSPDGRCLAVASVIGVWLYEAATSRALALLPTERAVHAVAFSPDGTLASASPTSSSSPSTSASRRGPS